MFLSLLLFFFFRSKPLNYSYSCLSFLQCSSNDKKSKGEKNNNLANGKQKSAGGDFNHVSMDTNCQGCQDQGSNSTAKLNGGKSKQGRREGEPRGGGVNGFKGGLKTSVNLYLLCS